MTSEVGIICVALTVLLVCLIGISQKVDEIHERICKEKEDKCSNPVTK